MSGSGDYISLISMQKKRTIKIPSTLLYHLQNHDSTIPKTLYLTVLTPNPQTCYIVDINPTKAPVSSLPTTLSDFPAFELIEETITIESKKEVLERYEACSCDEINRVVQGFVAIYVNVEGYYGLPMEFKGYKVTTDNNVDQMYGIDRFEDLFKILQAEAQEIWSNYNGKYCRSLADKKTKESTQDITCGIQPFLSFEVQALSSFNFGAKKQRGIEELQTYFEKHAFLFPSQSEIQVKDIGAKVKNIIKQKIELKSRQKALTKIEPSYMPALLNCPRAHPTKIFNPHVHAKITKKDKYELITVKGMYEYYHYGDQGFTDNGWGCAYRSLQTLISWLNIQGHTEPMPQMYTIREIQQKLDQFDRSRKLKGSSTWIGATEISWLVPTITPAQIPCKILHIPDGKKILQKCQQFKQHFLTSGCPIMYGGGQYAYSIVGMHYNWKLGECEFLILDPHYTGEDDYGKILEKKGLVWRRPEEMFKPGVFYNFCMPIIK